MTISLLPRNMINEDHVIAFWKKICLMPRDQNPAIDNDGQRDEKANGPRDPFFYLCFRRTGPSVRHCKVLPDKGLFIPIVSVIASRPETTDPSVDLHDLARKDQFYTSDVSVELDGVPVPD